MANFIMRMFTPSNSDNSGMVAPQATRKPGAPKATAEGLKKKKTQTRYGGATALASAKTEADTAKKMLLGQ